MKTLMPRRKFLFMAPAIIAVSNLMPGHSIAKLLERNLDEYYGYIILPESPGITKQYFAYFDPGGDFHHRTKYAGIEEVTYERYQKIKTHIFLKAFNE